MFNQHRYLGNNTSGRIHVNAYLSSAKFIGKTEFVCAYHPVVLGSNPLPIIYAYSIYSQFICYNCHCVWKRMKKTKRGRVLQYWSPPPSRATKNAKQYLGIKLDSKRDWLQLKNLRL